MHGKFAAMAFATMIRSPHHGLALSKNVHWMFDEGLWSADDDLRVIVNACRFSENGPEPLRLSSFVGRHLQFDFASKLRPPGIPPESPYPSWLDQLIMASGIW